MSPEQTRQRQLDGDVGVTDHAGGGRLRPRHAGAGAGEGDAPAEPSRRRAFLQLIAAVAAIVAVALLVHGVYVLLVVAALVLVVMFHELGHFATAKWSGMKVTEYFLGFGPRLWSVRRGETEYGVKAIPAGGYVRIIGMTTAEEIDPPDEPRTYRRATFPRRLAVGIAGSTMHFVMAFLLLVGLFAFVGVPTVAGAAVGGLYDFASGHTPAQLAGLRAGDVFVSVNGRPVTDPSKFEQYVEAHAGRTLVVVVRRGSHDVTLRVTPVDGRTVAMKGSTKPIKPAHGPASGVIGIELDAVGPNKTSGFSSFTQAGSMLGSLTSTTIVGIGQVFSPHGLSTIAHDLANSTSAQTPSQQAAGADRPVSIVGVVQIASQAAQQDVAELLIFLAYVNIFFGIFNMFPMLPLDGGHVAIAVYERIRSRRGRRYFADAQKMMPFAYALLVFIAIFGLSALYLDIVSPVHLPGG